MRYCKKIDNLISETEYDLAKFKHVLANFPDAQTFGDFSKRNTIIYGFKSKSVNSKYTNFTIDKTYGGISVKPFYELEFSINNKREIIKIYSMPKQISLAKISTIIEKGSVNGIVTKKYIDCLKFSKFLNSLDKNNFAKDCNNQCILSVLQFIQEHPGARLIDKNLEPRIKKLLLFT